MLKQELIVSIDWDQTKLKPVPKKRLPHVVPCLLESSKQSHQMRKQEGPMERQYLEDI